VSGSGLDDAPPGGIDSSAPEALARVRVIVSRSVITYWPHPPHSQAHRDFTARRLIRDVFAVRERLGDPRVVPCFHCTFLPDMPSSATPGNSTSHMSTPSMPTWSSPRTNRLDIPNNPAIRFTRGSISWLHWFAMTLRPARLLASLFGSDRGCPKPSETFTSRLSTGWSPFPPLGMTTTSTGLLCRRDLHPLE
jgi:hypothetical protein